MKLINLSQHKYFKYCKNAENLFIVHKADIICIWVIKMIKKREKKKEKVEDEVPIIRELVNKSK